MVKLELSSSKNTSKNLFCTKIENLISDTTFSLLALMVKLRPTGLMKATFEHHPVPST
jgi:hypothetical protein